MAKMEKKLHGKDNSKSLVADLVMAIENNYNNTALRLHNISETSFENTIRKLINRPVSEIEFSKISREEIINILDGTVGRKHFYDPNDADSIFEYIKEKVFLFCKYFA